ncbi:uncharacterized protein E0L32_000043 [Thyridium curvatum]|uniref:4-coumarate--CoA ligase n=1 Tax=Thyridium curvatum TaxID=1093900 RepID=A0A507BEJ9_9PEZI|nr:uncharacterized protein E0L32_000043 [Thyridium curvatum]TPX15709.1 hypothetical protein E0L32_000043 [Thyridium curvatum]
MVIKSRWTAPIPRCSLQQWIFESSRSPLPDKKQFLDADDPENNYITLSEYRLLSKRVALGLIEAGLKPGDRVLVFSGNNIYFPSVFLGILMAGGIFTGANPTFVPRELAYQLDNSQATFMITAAAALDTALEAAQQVGLPRSSVFIFDKPSEVRSAKPGPGVNGRKNGARHWTELLAGDPGRAESWDWVEPADPANTTCCLNYSSGTTGVPKGVEVSHYSYVANGAQVVALRNLDPQGRGVHEGSRLLCFLPLYHAYGQTYFIANFARMQLPVYVMPSFDFERMLRHVQTYRITSLAAVPPIVVALAKHPLARKYDLSSLEAIGSGAAPLMREVAQEVEKMLWPAGETVIHQGWGMTEVTCTCMAWDPTQPAAKTGSSAVGELLPNCAARIVEVGTGTDPETNPAVEIREPRRPGELWVTGPTLMRGYWRNPKATAETVVVDAADGTRWLRTGDVAFVEQYRPGTLFHIVDRLKELIKVKGNQVAPAELEGVLLDRRDVADAAVVGVTIKGEEVPRAYVVRAAGSRVSEQEIAQWFAGRVARYKQLRGGVKFVEAIPKNPSGKILRKILRDQAQKEVGDRPPQASRLS